MTGSPTEADFERRRKSTGTVMITTGAIGGARSLFSLEKTEANSGIADYPFHHYLALCY
jgi:hypothetical protein